MPKTQGNSVPTAAPPRSAAAAAAGTGSEGAPTLALEEIGELQMRTSSAGVPTLAPPTETAAAAAAQADDGARGITAWQSGVHVTATWSNSAARNGWAAIEGLGWRRVLADNDWTFTTMVAILSHARQAGTTVNVRVEADNLIHEVYAW
jgi:hypothetical protein